MTTRTSGQAWVVAVDMGYGHQRPAHSLRHLGVNGSVLVANNYPGIPALDKKIWHESQHFYEFVSRFKKVPILGSALFAAYDRVQAIPEFYPRRDLSRPNIQVKQIYRLIKHQQWGKDLITRLAKKPLPLISTFFIPAFMAEAFGYPGEIYCLITDTDISRAWVPLKPHLSRINYFAPNYRVAERLKLYGVAPERIYLTGFPLPRENTGGMLKEIRHDLLERLVNLDPKHRYFNHYKEVVEQHLGVKRLPKKSNHPLTVTFAVGGAGAQRELGAEILGGLKKRIQANQIRVVLVAGIHNEVSAFFRTSARSLGLQKQLGKNIKIIFADTKEAYFTAFNRALRTTDILWTKPSELSFYCGLGIPIILSEPIGSQEVFNRKWLRTIGAGVNQSSPRYAGEWLFDWLDSGWLAAAALQGFIEAPKFGTSNIEKIIARQQRQMKKVEMVLQY